jgi:hypothetical protein
MLSNKTGEYIAEGVTYLRIGQLRAVRHGLLMRERNSHAHCTLPLPPKRPLPVTG